MPIESSITSTATHYESEVLDHLGLVAGMVDELGLVERTDQLLPKSADLQKVSNGQALKAMIINGLGFTQRALYLTPEFFRNKPVARLIGVGVEAAHLNDDLLGRVLDSIEAYGVDQFYSQLSVLAVKRLGLDCRQGHLDSSTFHVDGQYNSDHPPGEDSSVIHITKGYSRDHRSDLNQLTLQLICEGAAGIPVLMKPLSGNSEDKTDFRATVKQHIDQLRDEVGLQYLVADSALYTAETLPQLAGVNWITRVPESIKAAKTAIHAHAADLMKHPDTLSMQAITSDYADIPQRWVVVYSPEARQRALKTLNRQVLKQSEQEYRRFKALCQETFACQSDAEQALLKWQKQQKATRLSECTFSLEPRFKQPGRPAAGAQPDYYVVRINALIATDWQYYQQRLERKSCFILASNVQDQDALTNEALLAQYKAQQQVEGGFRFLKDPQFMAATLFLKSVKRMMALTAVMTLCLLVYAALQYRIRQALAAREQTFPNQLGKPGSNPTARWVFQCFAGIHVLSINQTQQLVLNLSNQHRQIITLLGFEYEKIYS
ncbi:MAG: IS1634 family transposase [Thiolinea sp.]